MEETLKEYYLSIDATDERAKNKYYHSLRVASYSKLLAISLNLSQKDIDLAYTIGILHDIGRFKQLKMFDSFSDENIDHADLGIKELFDKKEIEKYKIPKSKQKILKKAISYHNKYEIPNNLTDEETLFCKIIRDADKLDILYEIVNNIIKFKECDTKISKEAKKEFFEGKQVHKINIKNPNDERLVYLALLNDINFEWTKKYIKEQKIVDKFYNLIENKNIFKSYIENLKERGY